MMVVVVVALFNVRVISGGNQELVFFGLHVVTNHLKPDMKRMVLSSCSIDICASSLSMINQPWFCSGRLNQHFFGLARFNHLEKWGRG